MSKPGWYQDHSGSQPVWRYWDGTEWTDSTAPIQEAPAAPRAPQVTATTNSDPRNLSGLELFGRRLAAYVVDLFVVYAVTFPFLWVWLSSWQPLGLLPATPVGEFLAAFSVFLFVTSVLTAIAYFLMQMLCIPRLGATPGMKLFSISILPAEGSNISTVAFRRGLFFGILMGISVFGSWMSLSSTGTDTIELLSSWLGTLLVWAVGPAVILGLIFIVSSCAIIWSSDHLAWHDHWTKAHIGIQLGSDSMPAKPSSVFATVVSVIAAIGLISTFFVTMPMDDKVEGFVNELVKEGTLPSEASQAL